MPSSTVPIGNKIMKPMKKEEDAAEGTDEAGTDDILSKFKVYFQ